MKPPPGNAKNSPQQMMGADNSPEKKRTEKSLRLSLSRSKLIHIPDSMDVDSVKQTEETINANTNPLKTAPDKVNEKAFKGRANVKINGERDRAEKFAGISKDRADREDSDVKNTTEETDQKRSPLEAVSKTKNMGNVLSPEKNTESKVDKTKESDQKKDKSISGAEKDLMRSDKNRSESLELPNGVESPEKETKNTTKESAVTSSESLEFNSSEQEQIQPPKRPKPVESTSPEIVQGSKRPKSSELSSPEQIEEPKLPKPTIIEIDSSPEMSESCSSDSDSESESDECEVTEVRIVRMKPVLNLKARPFSLCLIKRKLSEEKMAFLRSYCLQKKNKPSIPLPRLSLGAKMKVTPTRAELRAGRSSEPTSLSSTSNKFQRFFSPELNRVKSQSAVQLAKRSPTIKNLSRNHVAVILSESSISSDEGEGNASKTKLPAAIIISEGEDEDEYQPSEPKVATDKFFEKLKVLQNTSHQQQSPSYAQITHPMKMVDPHERYPTQINRQHCYFGHTIHKEHNYSCSIAGPSNPEWREKPHRKFWRTRNKSYQLEYKKFTDKLEKPAYVMSEPWMFVPVLSDIDGELTTLKTGLGYEEVVRAMLKKNQPCRAEAVKDLVCARCDIDFSFEWFTFKAQRLCGECYKQEVTNRNGVIYWTEVTSQVREFTKRENIRKPSTPVAQKIPPS